MDLRFKKFWYFVLFNICLLTCNFFEKIQVNNGYGWDGIVYADIAKNLDGSLKEDAIDTYRIQRIFPSVIVFFSSYILGMSLTDTEIILHFSILNILLLNGSLLLWLQITKHFKFNKRLEVLSVIFLLLNFCNLKMPLYYPVLTDTASFFLGVLLLFSYVFDKVNLLLVVALFGAFTHPLLLPVAGILFLYPKKIKGEIEKQFEITRFIPFLVCTTFLIVLLFLFFVRPGLITFPHGINPINNSLLILSIIATLIYLYKIGKSIRNYKIIERIFFYFKIKRFLAFLILVLIISIVKYTLSNSEAAFNLERFALNLILQSITNPFQFIISHIWYVGPAIIFILLFQKQFICTVHILGNGLLMTIFFISFFLIGTETRQFIFSLPFFVLPLSLMLQKMAKDEVLWISYRIIGLVVLIAFLLSKVWLPLNQGEWTGVFLEFPDQYYFMNQGPWMSNFSYYVHLIVTILIVLSLLFLLKRYRLVNSTADL